MRCPHCGNDDRRMIEHNGERSWYWRIVAGLPACYTCVVCSKTFTST